MFKGIDQIRRAIKRSILKGCARFMVVVDWAVGHIEPLSRYTKRIIFVGLDFLTVAVAIVAAFALTPGWYGLLGEYGPIHHVRLMVHGIRVNLQQVSARTIFWRPFLRTS